MSNGHRIRLVLGVIETDTTFHRETVRDEPMWVGRCLFCQAKLSVPLDGDAAAGVTVEHIVPRHHGGTDELENLALACARCNGEKGRRHDNRAADDPRRLAVTLALLERRKERWPASARAPHWPVISPAGKLVPVDEPADSERAPTATVARLFIHPVKSLAGVEVSEATLGERGFVGDRRFMVVDDHGRFLSQRELPTMARVLTAFEADALVLSFDGVEPLRVPAHPSAGTRRAVRIWGDECEAIEVDDAGWLAARLGRSCRLVYLPDDSVRLVDTDYARHGEQVSFADGFPYLLVGQGSVDELSERLGSPVDVRRFRPNLVIGGVAPGAEDTWKRVQIGDVIFAPVKPCSRCVMIDLDPDTGARSSPALAQLATYRRQGKKVMFGQNLLAEGEGVVRVGDAVTLLG